VSSRLGWLHVRSNAYLYHLLLHAYNILLIRDEALKLVDQFYYAIDSYSLSGEEPNYVFQLNILQLKITLEASQLISQNRTATVKQYNAWVAMADQGDQLLKYTERFPEQMRYATTCFNDVSASH
jgi:hypothetical protein